MFLGMWIGRWGGEVRYRFGAFGKSRRGIGGLAGLMPWFRGE